MATSAGLNVLLDASSFVANVSATCFVFMVGWFRSTLLKSGVFFSGRTFSIAGPQRREVFFLVAHFQWQTLRHVRRAPQDAAKRFQVAQGWRQSLNKRIVLSGHAFVSAPSERGNVVVFFWSSIFFVGTCLPLMVFFVFLIRHLRCTLPNAGMFFSGRAFSVTTFTRRYVFPVEYVFGSRLLPVDFF